MSRRPPRSTRTDTLLPSPPHFRSHKLGTNPFAFGFVGSSDFHNGLSDSTESAYAGNGLNSTDPKVNLPDPAFAKAILSQKVNPAGEAAPAANMQIGRAQV